MNIVADDKVPYLKGVFESFANICYLPGGQIDHNSLKHSDCLITRSVTKCDENLLKDTSLQLIASATIGDDHIDKDYCSENGIKWVTAKGCNAAAVEQYVLASLLGIAEQENIELHNKQIGIIGVGHIGSRIAKVSRILGMNALLNDPPRERKEKNGLFSSIGEIKREADIITLHVPLNYTGRDKTLHLLDNDFFNSLSKEVFLINSSRGAVIDSEALKGAKKSGIVRRMVLDVWENEPHVDPELIDIADIATPHIAGYTIEGKANGTAMVVNAISSFFDLPVKNWYPVINYPEKTFDIDCSESQIQDLLTEIFETVYDIRNDSEKLKSSPRQFENIRREYQFRSPNKGFNIHLKNCNPDYLTRIQDLEFNIQN